MATQSCSKCKYDNPVEDYMKGKRQLKQCLHCRASAAKTRLKHPPSQGNKAIKCPHGKRRYECVDCGGVGICEHKKKRHFCLLCEGASVCKHDRQKHQCGFCKRENSLLLLI
jgi:hypothetical protein